MATAGRPCGGEHRRPETLGLRDTALVREVTSDTGSILWWDGPSATILDPVLLCQFQKLAGDQCGGRVRDVAEGDCPSQGDTPNLCSLPPRKQDVLVMGG